MSGDNELHGKNTHSKSKPNLFLGTIKSERPPPVSADMELLREAEFPICAYHFFATFLSDKSSFMKEFHLEHGDKNIIFSQWKQLDAKSGYMRNMTFSTPLGFSLGPESTHCDQTQRYSFYQHQTGEDGKTEEEYETSLVYETSQINTDVPYGDYFRVCTRWDIIDTFKHGKVESDEDIEQYMDHTCKLKVHLSVPFSKSTIMKGTIVQKTKQQCNIFYDKLISAINKHIYSLMETSMMGNSQKIVSDQDLSSRIPAEWRQQIQLMLNLPANEESPRDNVGAKASDFLQKSYSSFTEHMGYSSQEGDRSFLISLKGVIGMLYKIIVWVLNKGNVLLLMMSLALNLYVLYVLYKGDIPGMAPQALQKDPAAIRGVYYDNFWKTKRTHLVKEMQILEEYLELLKTQQQLAKSME